MQLEKSLSKVYHNVIQDWIGLLCLLGMVLGFVVSRSLLTVSMILIFVNAFWPLQFKEVWRKYVNNRFALAAGFYYLIVFIGGVWSEKQDVWLDIVLMQLPLLILPLGILTAPLDQRIFRKRFLIGLYAILLGVICVSLVTFFLHYEQYVAGYAHSKQIPTTKYEDHIRFSIFLALSIIPGIAYIREESGVDKDCNFTIFIYAVIAVIVLYLHVLSAKSGLLALYVILGFFLFQKLRQGRLRRIALLLPPVALIVIGGLGYLFVETFQAKVDYVMYEFRQIFSDQPLNYNYSSAGRLISYQVAVEGIRENFVCGVGTGDVMQQMRNGYHKMYPTIPPENHLIPHSQFLYSLMSFGILFFPVFLIMVLTPFFAKVVRSQYSYLLISTIVMLVSMSFESMIQVQMGVFVYLFYTLIWYRWKVKSEA